jgi:co-chaperonin GroES (HSP10)
MQENLKYVVKDTVLMKHVYEDNTSNLIQVISRNLENKQNYITKVVKLNYDKEKYKYHNLNEGDLIFVSRYIATRKKFVFSSTGTSLDDNRIKYSTLPMLLVMGVFRDGNTRLESLEILDDKVLVEEIRDLDESGFKLPDAKEATVGRVIKVGKGGFNKNWVRREKPLVKEGDIVLFMNNVSTEITLHGKKYLCFEDNRLMGVFKNPLLDTISKFVELKKHGLQ